MKMEKTNSASGQLQEMSPFSANRRWLNVGGRTLHIAMAAVLFGGWVLAVPFARLEIWHWLTIVSGVGLMSLEWMHDRCWWHRGKGLLVGFHLGLCLLIHVVPGFAIPLLWLILISGCLGSHMSRRYRHWSVIDGWERREEFSRKARSE